MGIITGIILAMVVSSIIFIKSRNKETLNFADWFVVSLGVFYGLGQSFVLWNTYSGLNSSILGRLLRWDWYIAFSHMVATIIAIIAIYVGYSSAEKLFTIPQLKKLFQIFEIKSISIRYFRSIAWGFLLTSIICYLLYADAYGGILGLLKEARAIRSDVSSIENSFSFLQRFGGFAFFASFIFQGLIIVKRRIKTQWSDWIGLMISFLWSLLVLKSWMGRVGTAVYIITFFLGKIIYANYHKKTKFITLKIIVLFITGCLLMPYIGLMLERNVLPSSMRFFTSELTFPLVSWEVHQERNTNIRWFKDIVFVPMYFLPEKIWGNWIDETASNYNTRLIASPDLYGAIPVDYLTFIYLQGWWIGIILCSLLWGGILYFIEEQIKRIKMEGVRAMLYANILLNLTILTVLYADPIHLVRRLFYLVAGIIVLSLASRIVRIRIV